MKTNIKNKKEIFVIQYQVNDYNADWVTEYGFEEYPDFKYFCKVFSKISSWDLTDEVLNALEILYGNKHLDDFESYGDVEMSIVTDYRFSKLDIY